MNGKATQVKDIRRELAAVAGNNSVVCLHRENPQAAEPHPNMLKVLDAVIERKLSVAFFWDASFQKRVSFKE